MLTHFRSSRSFLQLGNFLFNQLAARQIRGSAKNPKPTKKVVIFINIAEVVNIATTTAGTSKPANLNRGSLWGKGGVGDNALIERFSYAGRSSHLGCLLDKPLPTISNISDDMHDWSHLDPHSILHWLLGFVVRRVGFITLS